MSVSSNSVIASTLQSKKYELAEVFANALSLSPRWKAALEAGKSHWKDFLEEEFIAYSDYLRIYFETGNEAYKYLLLGEKLKSLYETELNADERRAHAKEVQLREKSALEALLKADLGDSWEHFIHEFESLTNLLWVETSKNLHVLFVGDCLFLDILPFVVGPLIKEDISIHVDYVTSKNPIEARNEIKKFSAQKTDLVFFSPFTYDFSPSLASVYSWKNVFQSEASILKDLESAWGEAKNTIDVMADLFDCPVYVHNTSFITRGDSEFKRFLRLQLSARIRHFSKHWLNKNISAHLDQVNQDSFKHLFLIDETKQLAGMSELSAGSLLYHSNLQHPSVMGMEFAKAYVEIIYAAATLRKKKLVVTDLDNTLWNGVIGEGAVEHYLDRQALLKALKVKGVVLAVNSKNDPANVHWTNATLSSEDFVYEAINWQPKVQNLARIRDELNLKTNSFIFIDDREDELELMKTTYPEIVCLNATDPKTWERLGVWLETLEDDMEMDRTLMYQQREKRKQFVKEDVASDEERFAMFSTLELRLSIKRPEASDIKRITELINRTNQFNLEGTRVTIKDMTSWYNDANYMILCGRTADRFGDMGVTCVAVGQFIQEEFKILAFVLSCRVFGYQFEHSVMNHIKRLAAKNGAKTIKAKYTATAQNSPCKDFLKDCGFVESADFSVFDLSDEIRPDAAWIKVDVE